MSAAYFITISAASTSGTLGTLPRIPVLVTRETVSGYTADPLTGLIKINSTDQTTFNTANATKYGLRNALNAVFGQSYYYPYVYILSVSGGVASSDLDKANVNPRAWSFLSVVSQYQGGGTGGAETATFLADWTTIGTWLSANSTQDKIGIGTWSLEESAGTITLPAGIALAGVIGSNNYIKMIVSNSQNNVVTTPSPIVAYDNVALAWASYCINGPAVSRSWGSLSDAHDFAYVHTDSYTTTSRNIISNASLGQYNGAKDRAGSVFVYDTQMNDSVNPPLTVQIESLLAKNYIKDYTYVIVHNAVQSAGQTGLTNDDPGIQVAANLVTKAMNACFSLGLILAKSDGSPNYQIKSLTATAVDVLSTNWRTTGVWPSGVITATVQEAAYGHYITINFNFTI